MIYLLIKAILMIFSVVKFIIMLPFKILAWILRLLVKLIIAFFRLFRRD
ncbi:MAG: hypothetical protein FWC11_00270 [Firmicutes bacterium]|nr:hypothetical protein [Bacillota bacterium]